MCLDKATEQRRRVQFASNDELPKSILVEVESFGHYDISVEYVWKPPKCDLCHLLANFCKAYKREWQPKMAVNAASVNAPGVQAEGDTSSADPNEVYAEASAETGQDLSSSAVPNEVNAKATAETQAATNKMPNGGLAERTEVPTPTMDVPKDKPYYVNTEGSSATPKAHSEANKTAAKVLDHDLRSAFAAPKKSMSSPSVHAHSPIINVGNSFSALDKDLTVEPSESKSFQFKRARKQTVRAMESQAVTPLAR